MVTNPRKETARHEYYFSWSILETVLGDRKVAARGGLFCIVRPLIKGGDMKKKILPTLGIVGLFATFFYYVIWPPAVRTSCHTEARDATLSEINSVYQITPDTSNRYGLIYMNCVNKHGLAD